MKVGDNQMSPAQRIHKKRIEKSKGLHFVPRSLNEFIETVEEIKNE
ncbi:hypothetical protein [Schnuerera sp.]|nr:hypothetical protein [Schnuerera sp.]HSH36070.1 hypothetical protein [Schnuerera sp.]